MPGTIAATMSFDVKCAECGDLLNATITASPSRYPEQHILVVPCAKCLDAAVEATDKPYKIPAYTVAAAARKLGVTPATVYRWLDDGILDDMGSESGLVLGKVRLVSIASVERKVAADANDAGK